MQKNGRFLPRIFFKAAYDGIGRRSVWVAAYRKLWFAPQKEKLLKDKMAI